MQIFKFPLACGNSGANSNLSLPEGYKILKLDLQHGMLNAWVEVPENVYLTKMVRFTCVATGEYFKPLTVGTHVETVIDGDGYVWHIYVL